MVKTGSSIPAKHGVQFSGGGLTGEAFRAVDWKNHSLGAVENWPAALMATLNVLYYTKHPMFVFWGPEQICFYNDAYLPSITGKHPRATGQRGEECWPEIWSVIKPQIDLVLQTGGATWYEEQFLPIYRESELEEMYWTYSYSPIINADGSIGGVAVIVSDVTPQVHARKAAAENAKLAQEDNARLHAVFYGTDSPMVLFRGPDLIFEMANQKYLDMIFDRDVIGKTLAQALPEIAGSEFPRIIRAVYDTGQPYRSLEGQTPILNPTTGKLENRYFDTTFARITDDTRNEALVIGHSMDVTERVGNRKALEEATSALESMSDGFFTVDKDWRYTYVNQNMEKATGLSRAEMIGKSHLDLFFSKPAQQNSKNWREYHRVMKSRETTTYEDYYEPLNIWSFVRIYPKADGGLTIFFSDITEVKKAERLLQNSEISFKAITEATPLIVWTATADGSVDYANSRWYEFSGMTEGQTLGVGFLSAVHPEDIETTKTKYAEALKTLQPLEIEHRFKRKSDNSYRWFLTRAVPSINEHGQAAKWFGTNVDIEDQKRVAAELNEAKSDAERANQAKSAFLANMSHEIRTPLGAIIGFTDLLQERNLNSEERDQYLDTISRNGKALTKIIDDILDLAKVESGKLAIEHVEFSVQELISDVMDLFRERAKSKGIYLRSVTSEDVPRRITTDPTRLRQILINLVGNAVKFTDQGGVSVLVKHSFSESTKVQLSIAVEDTGIGLSPEQQTKLFEPFMQADNSTTRRFGGTGLGLALSKRLASALGGQLNVSKSELGQGCTFTISVPIAPVTKGLSLEFQREGKEKVPRASALDGLRVLVADDSLDNQFLIKIILNKLGIDVELVSNGHEAFQKAMSGNFDLVLMDIQMPVMDGYESTRKLRESGFTKPIIALTAHAMAEERARTKAVGCNSHLTKPIVKSELIFTLEEYASGEFRAAAENLGS